MNSQPASLSNVISKTKSEIQPREIHIWEFPQEGFRVHLEPKIAESLVKQAAEKVGGIETLMDMLKICISTINNYKAGRNSIPLSILLKLCELAGNKFAIEKIESHIVGYKGGRSASPILNPKLPIVESPKLFAFMGHLMGDGGHNIKYASYYMNTNDALIQGFLGLLHSNFGNVHANVFIRKREAPSKDITDILFGMAIVRLLRHIYQIDFRTYTARVPKRLFELPREYAAAFLRAFGDDEGTIRDEEIKICSANEKLIQDLYDLIWMKFPELEEFMVIGDEIVREFTKYFIRFRTGAFTDYRELIGFNHSEKKQELDQIMTRRVRGWTRRNSGTTRRMLLQVLKSRAMTAKELARAINVTVSAIRYHMEGKTGLIAAGFVRVPRVKTKAKGANVFELTESGQNWRFSKLLWKGI